MESLYEAERSSGEKFFRDTYVLIAKQLKIDPIREGRILRNKINVLYYSKIEEIEDEVEREQRVATANKWTIKYGKRLQKFFTVFQRYCFLKGEFRAIETLGKFIGDAVEEEERLEKQIEKTEEVV